MLTNITDSSRAELDARVEIQPNAIVIHSRGGVFGKPNLRNPDYRKIPNKRVIVNYRNGEVSPAIEAAQRRWDPRPRDIGESDWDMVAWRESLVLELIL